MTEYERRIREMHNNLPENERPKMQKEHLEKRNFVEGILTDCLHAAEPKSISFLRYEKILNDEIVTIYFVGGGTKSVFVTCDSKLAVIEDVMKIVY